MDRKALGLRSLQWFFRSIQCTVAAIILAIYSYILATLHNHKLSIKNSARAVEGISGFAVLYAAASIVLLCCIAGRTLAAFAAMVLDFAFLIAFIYVAAANKAGASSCNGEVSTMFGKGNSTEKVDNEGHGGFTKLPTYGQACKLESAVLGLAIIALFFFCFSLLTEVALGRNHWRQKRLANDPNHLANDPDHLATGPAGEVTPPPPGTFPSTTPKSGFWSRLFNSKKHQPVTQSDNTLLQHPTPSEMTQRPEPPTHGTVTDLGHRPGDQYEQVIPEPVEPQGYQAPAHHVNSGGVEEYPQQAIRNPYDGHQSYDTPVLMNPPVPHNVHTASDSAYMAPHHQMYSDATHAQSYPAFHTNSYPDPYNNNAHTNHSTPTYDTPATSSNQIYTHHTNPLQASYVSMPIPIIPNKTAQSPPRRPLPYPDSRPNTSENSTSRQQSPQRYEPYRSPNVTGHGYPGEPPPRPPKHGGPWASSAAAIETYGERQTGTESVLPVGYQYDDGLYDRQ